MLSFKDICVCLWRGNTKKENRRESLRYVPVLVGDLESERHDGDRVIEGRGG